jgi:hypothetical protein
MTMGQDSKKIWTYTKKHPNCVCTKIQTKYLKSKPTALSRKIGKYANIEDVNTPLPVQDNTSSQLENQEVAHVCNPSYSGGRDQEDHSLKPVWVNNSRDPISKKPKTKRAGGVVKALSSNHDTAKKEKEIQVVLKKTENWHLSSESNRLLGY